MSAAPDEDHRGGARFAGVSAALGHPPATLDGALGAAHGRAGDTWLWPVAVCQPSPAPMAAGGT